MQRSKTTVNVLTRYNAVMRQQIDVTKITKIDIILQRQDDSITLVH